MSRSGENIGKRFDFGPCFCCVVLDFLGFDRKDSLGHGLREELDPDSFEGSAVYVRRLLG